MEFEHEHSYFSDFKLIKITCPEKVNIGVIDNEIVAFKNLILPSSIRDKKGEDWTKKLSILSDRTFFGGEKDDILNVKFDKLPDWENYYLVFRACLRANYPSISKISKKLEKISPLQKKWTDSLKKIAFASATTFVVSEAAKPENVLAKTLPLSIYIYSNNHKKKLVKIVHPRERFSLGLVDFSKYVEKKDNSVSLKMEWTKFHNLSFVGLAEVKPLDSFQVKQKTIELSKLRHSENKDVDEGYLKDEKVELIPGQFIELEFPAEKENINSNQKTFFILKSKGHYTSL